MRTARGLRCSVVLLLHSVDRLGRAIAPTVLEAAHGVAPRVVRYAERALGDGALAINLLEEAAAAVSQVLEQEVTRNTGPIRDLEAYLFRTYLRKVNLTRTKQNRLDRSLQERAKTQPEAHESTRTERALLFEEVMATYDEDTRQIVYRRLEGFSWDEIGAEFGLKPHAAEVRYSRALAKARKALNQRRRPPS